MRPTRDYRPPQRWFTHAKPIAAGYDIFLFSDPAAPTPDDGLVPVGDELLRVSADEQTVVFFCRGPVATPHVRLEVFDTAPGPLTDDWPQRQETMLQLPAGRRGLTTLTAAEPTFEFDVVQPGRYQLRAARARRPRAGLEAPEVSGAEPDPECWIIQLWPSEDPEPEESSDEHRGRHSMVGMRRGHLEGDR